MSLCVVSVESLSSVFIPVAVNHESNHHQQKQTQHGEENGEEDGNTADALHICVC